MVCLLTESPQLTAELKAISILDEAKRTNKNCKASVMRMVAEHIMHDVDIRKNWQNKILQLSDS